MKDVEDVSEQLEYRTQEVVEDSIYNERDPDADYNGTVESEISEDDVNGFFDDDGNLDL